MTEELGYINIDSCEDFFVFIEVYKFHMVAYGRASFDEMKFRDRFGPAALREILLMQETSKND